MIEPGDKGTERLLTLRLHSSDGPVTLLSAYAPTQPSPPDVKDEFYTILSETVQSIEQLLLLRDFNAKVGTDHDSWPNCFGPFGTGKFNENGQRLLELYSYHGLCITNSYEYIGKIWKKTQY